MTQNFHARRQHFVIFEVTNYKESEIKQIRIFGHQTKSQGKKGTFLSHEGGYIIYNKMLTQPEIFSQEQHKIQILTTPKKQ